MGKRILVPIDRSEQAQRALDTALDVFEGDDLVFLHVVEMGALDYAGSMLGGYDRSFEGEIEDLAEEQARQLLDRAVETARDHGMDARGEVRVGKPAPEIIEYAAENDVDYVVIGSHGYEEISRQWFGSVADRVVKGSPVSVMVVR
ncbi:MAG: universal stress protein [Haloferacaceae archaeon]